MALYAYAGVTIFSTLSLPELSDVESDNNKLPPDFTFRLLNSPPRDPSVDDWIQHWGSTLSLSRRDGEFLLRFPDKADFIISVDGRQIAAWPAQGTDDDTLRHFLLDQVLPRVLAHQDQLVLHASAVALGGQIIAFMGKSGQGKSTLAASLHVAGFPIVTDDGLVVTPGDTQAMAQPTYLGLRLWLESVVPLFGQSPALAPMAHYSSKRRVVQPEKKSPTRMPLAGIYVLKAPGSDSGENTVNVSLLSVRDAAMALIKHSFQLDVDDRWQGVNVLTQASDIVAQLPVFSLSYPRDYSCLPAVHAAIFQQCEHLRVTADYSEQESDLSHV